MKRLISLIALAAQPFVAQPIGAQEIPPDALDSLRPADVVVLGEVHDNPAHHLNQARAVAALKPAALVFEMLPADRAAAAPALRDDMAALGAALGWDGSGWPDFALYYPVFAAAPSARLYGAEVPRDQIRKAISDGAAAAFGPGAEGVGLDAPLSPDAQAEQEDEQFAAHCDALPRAMLPGMVEAQRLRDAFLMAATLRALEETGGPVAVIAGAGHARQDRGFVAGLAAAGIDVLAIGQAEADPGPDAPWDQWLVTDPSPREDPCAAFGAAGN